MQTELIGKQSYLMAKKKLTQYGKTMLTHGKTKFTHSKGQQAGQQLSFPFETVLQAFSYFRVSHSLTVYMKYHFKWK